MKKFWKAYSWLCNQLTNLFQAIAGICMTGMFLIMIFDILCRITISKSLISQLELAGYALAFLTMAGLAWAFKNDGFIRVGILYNRIRGRFKAWTDVFLHAVILAYIGLLTRYLWVFVIYSKQTDARSMDVMRTALWIPRLVLAISVTVFLLILIKEFMDRLITALSYRKSATEEADRVAMQSVDATEVKEANI